jgi:flagellar biosynthetic protein FlhB|nr:flagellar biosynthesis protein FlhB [uncultured Acetatifactor sp.]
MIRYNLQFFAKEGMGGEKTEPATQKKLEDARKKGQVAKSRELTNGLELLALFLILKFWVGNMGIQFLELFGNIYSRIPEVTVYRQNTMPEREASVVFAQLLFNVLLIVAPIFLLGYLIAFVTDVAQVKWKPTFEPLRPKFSKLNPISGFKKIFSANAMVELVKSIAKILLIGYVCYSYLKDKWPILFNLYDVSLMQALQIVAETVTDLGIRVAVFYMVLAFADYAYQKFKFSKDMKMTKQEVKEEYKQQEGDPQVKGKIKQKMRETSMKRMMQSLPQADVVITNPTHYAVAIKYDPQVADAPLVIAKGEDYLAARIKEVAKENNIEIVENKPLARMLYANVDIGQAVPPELYQAVAEVLAFVYHLQGKI